MKPLANPARLAGLLALVALSMTSTACLGHKEGSRTDFPVEIETKLDESCKEMKAIGDYAKIKARFDRKIEELLRISDRDPVLIRERVEKVSDAIELEASRLRELAKSEWNEVALPATYEWTISPRDFGVHTSELKSLDVFGIQVLEARVYGQILDGYKVVSFEKVDNSYRVRIEVPSTSFELCALTRSVVFHVVVRYSTHGLNRMEDLVLSVKEKAK